MLWFLVASIVLVKCAASAGDILRGVDVPLYAFAGGQATLSCSYDLRSTRLYSLKWYHNGTEFYRYVPTQRQQISIKSSPKFAVHELFRSDQRVTLSLTKLSVSASGQYRCEVIAEHPSFRTEASTATMTVLREPLSPPVLVGGKEIYEPTELIKIGCQPRRPFHGGHVPTLQWFLEGSKVARAGGSLQAECRLTLGPHEHSSFKTLRVRIRMISYVENYQSSAPYGGGGAGRSSLTVSLLLSVAAARL